MGYLCKVRFRRVTNTQKVTMEHQTKHVQGLVPHCYLKVLSYLKYKEPTRDHKRDFEVLTILKGKTKLKHAALTQDLSGK